jgi:hypothetical protein
MQPCAVEVMTGMLQYVERGQQQQQLGSSMQLK